MSGMTRMSQRAGIRSHSRNAKYPELLMKYGVAHRLLLIGLMASPSACVLPLQFEETRDAGADQNNPPAIVLAPSMLEVANIDQSSPPTFTVSVEDKDVDDVLFLRVFRDYHLSPDSAVTDLPVPSSGLPVRTQEIDTATWCPPGTPPTTTFIFEILVSDRPFLPLSEEPFFRALPSGAKSARGYWVGACQ